MVWNVLCLSSIPEWRSTKDWCFLVLGLNNHFSQVHRTILCYFAVYEPLLTTGMLFLRCMLIMKIGLF